MNLIVKYDLKCIFFLNLASVSVYFVVVIFSHLKVYLGVNDTNFLPDGVAVDPIPHPHFINNKPGHDIMLLKVTLNHL